MNSLAILYGVGTLLAYIFHLAIYKKGRFERPYPISLAGYACLFGWPLIIAFLVIMTFAGLVMTLIESHRKLKSETG